MKIFLSISIIVVIFSSILYSAFFILEKGIRGKNSNLKIAKSMMHKQVAVVNAGTLINIPKPSCANLLTEHSNLTLVDFLNSIGMDSSFDARVLIAVDVGIINYQGLSWENTRILDYLLIKFIRDNDCMPRG